MVRTASLGLIALLSCSCQSDPGLASTGHPAAPAAAPTPASQASTSATPSKTPPPVRATEPTWQQAPKAEVVGRAAGSAPGFQFDLRAQVMTTTDERHGVHIRTRMTSSRSRPVLVGCMPQPLSGARGSVVGGKVVWDGGRFGEGGPGARRADVLAPGQTVVAERIYPEREQDALSAGSALRLWVTIDPLCFHEEIRHPSGSPAGHEASLEAPVELATITLVVPEPPAAPQLTVESGHLHQEQHP